MKGIKLTTADIDDSAHWSFKKAILSWSCEPSEDGLVRAGTTMLCHDVCAFMHSSTMVY